MLKDASQRALKDVINIFLLGTPKKGGKFLNSSVLEVPPSSYPLKNASRREKDPFTHGFDGGPQGGRENAIL